MSIPENLDRLHAGEEVLRERTKQMVEQSPDLADHLDMMERTMDLLDMLRKHTGSTADESTICQLGMRCFNYFAASWRLTSSGYYQAGTSLLRDLIETSELVDYLYGEPDQVAVWQKADRKQLISEFGPGAIRKKLDLRAGQGKSRREEIYRKFSTLASHPTVNGFAMLRPTGSSNAVSGPFCDVRLLRAVLEETGKLAAMVGFVFALYLDMSHAESRQVAHRFVSGVMDYSGKYLGKSYTPEERAEVDQLYGGSQWV